MKQRKSDILWKVVLEEVFDDLLRFLSADAAIFVFLENYVLFEDQEMNRIFRERIQSEDKNNVMNIDDYVKMISKEEGLEEGEQRRNRLFVGNLLSNTDFTVEKIASLADVTVAFVNQIKNESKTK